MGRGESQERGGGAAAVLIVVALGATAYLCRPAEQPEPPGPDTRAASTALEPPASSRADATRPIQLRDLLTGRVVTASDPRDARRMVDSHTYEALTPEDAARVPPAPRTRSRPPPIEPAEAPARVAARHDEARPLPRVPTSGSGGSVHVHGYYRRDGTYVHPHTRHAPRR